MTVVDSSRGESVSSPTGAGDCYHCGAPCGRTAVEREGRRFCCTGCLTVHDLLQESGLGGFYDLSRHPGVQVGTPAGGQRWAFLDDPDVSRRLLDFSDGRTSRVTFHVPAIHCVACVWLLENLFQLHPGIGRSEVNFGRREVSLAFAADQISLGGVAALLDSLGYAPTLTLGHLDQRAVDPARRRRVLQTGVAGFAFGNIMLFSLPAYLGLDSLSGPLFHKVFGLLSLALALPVLLFSASDYWRSALASFRQRTLTLDVPITLGLVALYSQSAWMILRGTGEGYLDSLAGLVFFLLCGRWFQDKTHERLAFDRDYRSFFPLAVTRVTPAGEEQSVALSALAVGDRLRLRHDELIPADAVLLEGRAAIDYSFVTGESEVVERQAGEVLHAGGRQRGGAIEVEIVKPVSQSYLASLWSHETFRKENRADLNTLTNRFGRWFTFVVIGVAVSAGLAWTLSGDATRGVQAFVSVLIVACPCALALSFPFASGTAQRWLARAQVFLKNAHVLERMNRIDTVVFDKTGTLTTGEGREVGFEGDPLGAEERGWVRALVGQSAHPLAARLAITLPDDGDELSVDGFQEIAGRGLLGQVDGHRLVVGSWGLLREEGIALTPDNSTQGSVVELAIDGVWRGRFLLPGRLRPEIRELIAGLGRGYSTALVSGDNERERDLFAGVFGPEAELRFNQSPFDKLRLVEEYQASGRRVMMVGDGLNDAGALRQSDVGVAVVERVGTFSPASDVILASARVPDLGKLLKLARGTERVVLFCFALSALYNAVGVSVAAAGWLSPVFCAVLMPLSSVSVVLVACGATTRAVRRSGLKP